MKIGILTSPLKSNYGGILQNWALQQVLIKLGHKPILIFIRIQKLKYLFFLQLSLYYFGLFLRIGVNLRDGVVNVVLCSIILCVNG